MAWVYIILGGICEIFFAFSAERAQGYTKLVPTLMTLGAAGVSMWFVSLAMKTLPVGTAYAVWTGIGAFGTALVGIIVFGEPKDFWRVFFLGMVILGTIGLQVVSNK